MHGSSIAELVIGEVCQLFFGGGLRGPRFVWFALLAPDVLFLLIGTGCLDPMGSFAPRVRRPKLSLVWLSIMDFYE